VPRDPCTRAAGPNSGHEAGFVGTAACRLVEQPHRFLGLVSRRDAEACELLQPHDKHGDDRPGDEVRGPLHVVESNRAKALLGREAALA
jgi:hypothetical protein